MQTEDLPAKNNPRLQAAAHTPETPIALSASARAHLGERLVVASLSGGKDSTALALFLRELEIPHRRVFADTGFEAAETYAYLDRLRERLGPIDVVRNEALWQDARPGEEGMLTLIRKKQMFPSRLMRFCTQQLKLRPIRDHLRGLQDRGLELVSAVGVRADESAARADLAEWEQWDEIDAEVWRPILKWTEQDVIDMHRRHGVSPNPRYLQGARRVGCNPCIYARKHDLRLLPAEQLTKIRRVEQELTADAIARGCERPTRAFFQIRNPEGLRFTPIDEVVRLAHLHRGRPILDAAEPAACVRWGLCDAADPPSGQHVPMDTSGPDPVEPRRFIGHDHLEHLGISPETIGVWIARGWLVPAQDSGFYRRTRELDDELARLTARRVIGRAHLQSVGITPTQIAGWIRRGTLRRTRARGFYEITVATFESLPRPVAPEVAADDMAPNVAPAELAVVEPAAAERGPDVVPAEGMPALDRESPLETTAAGSPKPASPLRVVPCTIGQARNFVAAHHRHLAAPLSGLFAVGVACGPELVGVAIVGRPVARELQDGATAEITRVCTQGHRNACSMLLAACRRGALALGYRRLMTYTLASEPGTSLRAAGWRPVAEVRGRSWNCPSRPRAPGRARDKRRWEAPLQHREAAACRA